LQQVINILKQVPFSFKFGLYSSLIDDIKKIPDSKEKDALLNRFANLLKSEKMFKNDGSIQKLEEYKGLFNDLKELRKDIKKALHK